MQEVAFVQAKQLNGEILLLDSQLHPVVDHLHPGIQRADELIRPAFDFKGDHVIVWHNDGPDVQVMGRHGRNYEAGRFRENDRPPQLREYPVEPVGVATMSPSAQ